MSIPLLPGIFLFFLRKAANAYNKQKPSTTKLCCVMYNRENWLISLLRKAVKMIKNNWRKHWLFSEIKLTSTDTQGLLRRGSSLRSDPSPFDRHDKSRGASVHTTQSRHWYWPYQGVGTCASVLTLSLSHTYKRRGVVRSSLWKFSNRIKTQWSLVDMINIGPSHWLKRLPRLRAHALRNCFPVDLNFTVDLSLA